MVLAFLAGTSVLDPAKGTMAPCGSRRLREIVPGSNALGCIGLGLPGAPTSCLIGAVDVVAIRPLGHALTVASFRRRIAPWELGLGRKGRNHCNPP